MSDAMDSEVREVIRRPFPLGRLRPPHAVVCTAAVRPPLIGLNRYPGQVIGVSLRLKGTSYLSIVWARPSRWWA